MELHNINHRLTTLGRQIVIAFYYKCINDTGGVKILSLETDVYHNKTLCPILESDGYKNENSLLFEYSLNIPP